MDYIPEYMRKQIDELVKLNKIIQCKTGETGVITPKPKKPFILHPWWVFDVDQQYRQQQQPKGE